MSKFDMNKLMQQAQQMQSQMQQAQEEAANEVVEASAGGGMVTVKATGGGEIVSIEIDPKAIDPDDAEMLSDLILAAHWRCGAPRWPRPSPCRPASPGRPGRSPAGRF